MDDFDVALVGHVAMSSSGNSLPRILRGVLLRGGAVSTPELAADSGLTDPTVRHYMRLLGERGVAVHRKASPETVELTGQYEALYRAPIGRRSWTTGSGGRAESKVSRRGRDPSWDGCEHALSP